MEQIVIHLLIAKKLWQIGANPLRLGKISENFSVDNMKKAGLYGYVYDFSVDGKAIEADKILVI